MFPKLLNKIWVTIQFQNRTLMRKKASSSRKHAQEMGLGRQPDWTRVGRVKPQLSEASPNKIPASDI